MLNKNAVGMTLGTVGALYTLIWSVLVAVGAGQWSVVTKLNLLFLSNPFSVMSFSFVNMIVLVIGSFIGLYIFGWIYAWIWNWYNK